MRACLCFRRSCHSSRPDATPPRLPGYAALARTLRGWLERLPERPAALEPSECAWWIGLIEMASHLSKKLMAAEPDSAGLWEDLDIGILTACTWTGDPQPGQEESNAGAGAGQHALNSALSAVLVVLLQTKLWPWCRVPRLPTTRVGVL